MKFLVSLIFLISLSSFADSFVFMRENDLGKQIFLQNQDGLKQISSGPDWHLYPDITTDGSEIAYIKIHNNQFFIEIYKQTTKSFERWYFNEVAEIFHLNFSHNNEKLLFSSSHNGKQKLGFLPLNEARAIIAPTMIREGDKLIKEYKINHPTFLDLDYDIYFPRSSSDMSFVVYQKKQNGIREIILHDLITDEKKNIDEGMAPSLSFDEKFIAYTQKINDEWDIIVYDRFTKDKVKLSHPMAQDFAPSFDRANNLIFASDISGRFNLYKINYQDWIRGKMNFSSLVTPSSTSDDYAPQMSGDEKYELGNLEPFPAPARSSFGSIYHKGRVYLSGGHQGPEHTYPESSFTNTFQYFDIKTNTWHEAAKRHFKCHGYGLIAHENYIYAFGGFAYSHDHKPNWKSLSVVERYDITKNIWEIVGEMPRNRSSNIVSKVGDLVYLIGGWDSTPKFENDYDGNFLEEIDVFNLKTETFLTLDTKLPLKRRALSGVVFNEKIYLIGGLSEGANHFSLLNNVTEFDPATTDFTEKSPLPFETFAPAAGIYQGKLYVFGGMFKTGEMNYEYVSHIFESDFKSWNHTGRSLKETKGFSQVLDINNEYLMILGGHRYYADRDEPVRSVESFKIK